MIESKAWPLAFLLISMLSFLTVIGLAHIEKKTNAALEEHVQRIIMLKEDMEQLETRVKELETTTVKVKVTAYSNDPGSINVPEWRDGMTASGTVARVGVCAADWRVFPVGTKIEVPGYGECVVEDRGSAVKGKHIDLFFDTREEALQWGVQHKEVRVDRLG